MKESKSASLWQREISIRDILAPLFRLTEWAVGLDAKSRTVLCLSVLLLISATVIVPRFDARPPQTESAWFFYLPTLFAGHPFDLHEYVNSKSMKTPFYWKNPTTGLACSPWQVGPAITWLPAYGFTYLTTSRDVPLNDQVYWDACGRWTQIIALVGLAFLFLVLTKLFGRRIAVIVSLASLLCTPLLAYCTTDIATSHALCFALVSIFIWISMKEKPSWWMLGLVFGLMLDTRPQMVVFALIPFVLLRPKLIQIAQTGLTAFLTFIPQMIMWKETFGHWIANPQSEGGGFFHKPAVWQVLFSPMHGLYLWHPVLLIATLGLLWLIASYPKLRPMATVCLVVFVSQVLINGAANDWWAAGAFGNRRFCDCLPILCIGLAYLIKRAKPIVATLPVAAVWNLMLLSMWKGALDPWAPLDHKVLIKAGMLCKMYIPW